MGNVCVCVWVWLRWVMKVLTGFPIDLLTTVRGENENNEGVEHDELEYMVRLQTPSEQFKFFSTFL